MSGFNDGLQGDASNASNPSTWEYEYDANGNMVRDENKGITNITYNHLNLPMEIQKTGYTPITFVYDAYGTLLKRKSGNGDTYQYYAGPFVYTMDDVWSLNYILTSEGKVNHSGGNYVYEYHIKDHLGNTRVAFEASPTGPDVVQEADYFPFGMRFSDNSLYENNNNKYLYNGKEFFEEFGLDWYDYGARMYDAQIARWHVVDPDAENYFAYGTYVYVGNNPIRRVDPDGNNGWDVVLGASSAFLDNACGGTTNLRSSAANYVSDNKDFNRGLFYGDIASMAIGGAETAGGAGMTKAGFTTVGVGVVTATAGGVGVPVIVVGGVEIVLGTAMVAHGTVMMTQGTKNLAQGKGKMSEGDTESDNSTSTARDRENYTTSGEKAQAQSEGINKAQDQKKKQVKGQKQNAIYDTKKSDQKLQNELDNLKGFSLDEIEW